MKLQTFFATFQVTHIDNTFSVRISVQRYLSRVTIFGQNPVYTNDPLLSLTKVWLLGKFLPFKIYRCLNDELLFLGNISRLLQIWNEILLLSLEGRKWSGLGCFQYLRFFSWPLLVVCIGRCDTGRIVLRSTKSFNLNHALIHASHRQTILLRKGIQFLTSASVSQQNSKVFHTLRIWIWRDKRRLFLFRKAVFLPILILVHFSFKLHSEVYLGRLHLFQILGRLGRGVVPNLRVHFIVCLPKEFGLIWAHFQGIFLRIRNDLDVTVWRVRTLCCCKVHKLMMLSAHERCIV